MTAYNFQKRFADNVELGIKNQTIRKSRKYNPIFGSGLQLYSEQRTKNCRLLGRAICKLVTPIKIDCVNHSVILDGKELSQFEIWNFAKEDGFNNKDEFFQFFSRYNPLDKLVLIKWDLIK